MDRGLRSLATIIENLAHAQSKLLRAADAVAADQWKTRPAEGRWSAGEVISHLITPERVIISRTDKVLRKPPKEVPFFKRLHLPMAVAKSRIIRLKTPIPLDPETVYEKEEMLAELRQVREKTLAFMKETMERDLSKYRMPHPFLGMLNTYEWFQLIASHEIRHSKQMQEIAKTLPKTVTSLEK
jgi:DinB superfamily